VLFAPFGTFFEVVIDLRGLQLGAVGRLGLPILLIGMGVVMLALRMLSAREESPRDSAA
jgi:hypothetical protein